LRRSRLFLRATMPRHKRRAPASVGLEGGSLSRTEKQPSHAPGTPSRQDPWFAWYKQNSGRGEGLIYSIPAVVFQMTRGEARWSREPIHPRIVRSIPEPTFFVLALNKVGSVSRLIWISVLCQTLSRGQRPICIGLYRELPDDCEQSVRLKIESAVLCLKAPVPPIPICQSSKWLFDAECHAVQPEHT